MKTNNRSNQAHHGFTLIELLVVISIIALLVGILLPMLSKSRETARTVMCLSNERQIALAFGIFRTEHADMMPTSLADPSIVGSPRSAFDFFPYDPGQAPYCWADLLILGQYETIAGFDCPTVTGDALVSVSGAAPTTKGLEYGINAFLDQAPTQGGLRGPMSLNPTLGLYSSWPYTLITRPSDGLLLADSAAPLTDPYYVTPTHATSSAGIMRHSGANVCNVTYFDCHSASFNVNNAVLFDNVPTVDVYSTLVVPQPTPLWRPWAPYFN